MKGKSPVSLQKQSQCKNKTSQTHSQVDSNQTLVKSKLLKHRQLKKLSKSTKTNKSQTQIKLPVAYKCGCTNHSPREALSHIVSAKIITKIPYKTAKNNPLKAIKSAVVVLDQDKQSKKDVIKYSLNKIKPKQKLKDMLQKMNKLESEYQKLLSQKQQTRLITIEYVPREIIKSVDRIIKIQRPIQKRVLKIKKIPKQVIRYKQKSVQVPIFKEQLVFVNPLEVQGQQRIKYIDVITEKIKQTIKKNQSNERMKINLRTLREKYGQINHNIAQTRKNIDYLNKSIVQRAKSLQSLNTSPTKQSIVVLLDNQFDKGINSSVTTTLNKSDIFDYNRSQSQPSKGSSVLILKSKVFINGKQIDQSNKYGQINNTNLVKSIVIQSPRKNEHLMFYKSEPQISESSQR